MQANVEGKCLFQDALEQAQIYKWIESVHAERDCGPAKMQEWVCNHWKRHLRTRLVEHMQGHQFWKQLDRGDFGILRRQFREDKLLLDVVIDRIKDGKENLCVLLWAEDWGVRKRKVEEVLEILDVNSRRIQLQFGPDGSLAVN